jgi:hypothetical protein
VVFSRTGMNVKSGFYFSKVDLGILPDAFFSQTNKFRLFAVSKLVVTCAVQFSC